MERNIIQTICRNCKALTIRLRRAVASHNADAILSLSAIILREGMWLGCWLFAAVCFVCGFFAPHCFLSALMFVVLAAICRSNCDDDSACNNEEIC